jgi:acetyl-CoA decarbonylase/synthase complex subunit gamma
MLLKRRCSRRDYSNLDAMAALAKQHGAPLAVKGASLDELGELTAKLDGLGIKDLVLDPGTRTLKETHQNLVYLRRAALKKKLRPFGYPIISFPAEETAGDMMETHMHGGLHDRYGGSSAARPLARKSVRLYVAAEHLHRPQRPMQVAQDIYSITARTRTLPVLITTNFADLLHRPPRSREQGADWLAIVDTDGLSTLTAWAAGKFVPDRIAAFVNKSGLADKVKHRTVIIPGYVAQLSGELEEELAGWKVVVGPREASELPRSWALMA